MLDELERRAELGEWLDAQHLLLVSRGETGFTQTLNLLGLDGSREVIGSWDMSDSLPPDLPLKFPPFDFR